MSNVLNRTTQQFLQSVNTPDFDVADWIINPDLSAVAGQPQKFWIIDPPASDTVRLATAGEQATINAAIAAVLLTSQRDGAKTEFDAKRVLIGLAELLVDEFNVLRALHALPDRTFAQLRTAIRNKIDTG